MVSSVNRKPRGEDYQATLEKYIDYSAIGNFLVKEVNISSIYSSLLDVPCGTGILLQNIRQRNNSLPLYGMDISKRQLLLAKKNINDIVFFHGNIFSLNSYRSKIKVGPLLCHIGSCFFNTLDSAHRIKLLTSLYKTPAVSGICLEIQNVQHQVTFKTGQWYKTKLQDGTIMFTRSINIGENVKQLEMRFYKTSLLSKHFEILYDWPIEICKSDLVSTGWNHVKVVIPFYRSTESQLNSHWYLIAER